MGGGAPSRDKKEISAAAPGSQLHPGRQKLKIAEAIYASWRRRGVRRDCGD